MLSIRTAEGGGAVGTMEVGSTVDVRYHTKSKQHIATAVTVVHEKTAPAAGQ